MRLRPLPTLKWEAYNHAASELLFVLKEDTAFLLKFVGSNTWVIARTMDAQLKDHVGRQEALEGLVKRGYILEKPGWEDRGVDGMRPTTMYQVNWKQIRQLNKAISLL